MRVSRKYLVLYPYEYTIQFYTEVLFLKVSLQIQSLHISLYIILILCVTGMLLIEVNPTGAVTAVSFIDFTITFQVYKHNSPTMTCDICLI